jgi:hypothetical protein
MKVCGFSSSTRSDEADIVAITFILAAGIAQADKQFHGALYSRKDVETGDSCSCLP